MRLAMHESGQRQQPFSALDGDAKGRSHRVGLVGQLQPPLIGHGVHHDRDLSMLNRPGRQPFFQNLVNDFSLLLPNGGASGQQTFRGLQVLIEEKNTALFCLAQGLQGFQDLLSQGPQHQAGGGGHSGCHDPTAQQFLLKTKGSVVGIKAIDFSIESGNLGTGQDAGPIAIAHNLALPTRRRECQL